MGVGGQGHPQGLLPTAFGLSSVGKGQSDRAQLPRAVHATLSEVTKADGESFHGRWRQRWRDSWRWVLALRREVLRAGWELLLSISLAT